jgi:hypothetical protein
VPANGTLWDATEFTINDELSPLLSRDGNGGTHVLMPLRVQDPEEGNQPEVPAVAKPSSSAAADKPVPTVKPKAANAKPKTRRKNVTKPNEQKNDAAGLDRVLAACDAAKTKVKEAGQALTELGSAIRDAAREQKVQGREIESARSALAKLQAISL